MDIEKKETKKSAALRFDRALLVEVDAYAKRNGVSRTRFVEFACERLIKSIKRKERVK